MNAQLSSHHPVSIQEVARSLRLFKRMVYSLLVSNQALGTKIADRWCHDLIQIEHWLHQENLPHSNKTEAQREIENERRRF
jgi:hypothetical protein